jgi:hypothetical protein
MTATSGQEFMGIRAIVKVGVGTDYETEYALDFDQELLGMQESQKSWQLSCRACCAASGLRRPAWLSSIFYTGDGEFGEEEQRHTFQRALEECNEHVTVHERMAAWYEMLDQSPAFKRGIEQGSGRSL